MTFDDELTALMALDALEPEEQADAELRLGTFPADGRGAVLALAEGVADAPPVSLRADVLRAAVSRRAPNRPVETVVPGTPVDSFLRTADEFLELLASLTPGEWELPAHPEHGRVHDLVAHLIGIEQLSVPWLRGDPDAPFLPDHVASTRAIVASLSAVPSDELVQRWSDAAREVVAAAGHGAPDREVVFHDLTLSVPGYLVSRTFELWAHGMDIALATSRPIPVLDDARMLLMSSRLMDAVPRALAYRRTPLRGRTARFVLTGPAGGCYEVPLALGETAGQPDVVVVADVVDICRLAARRLTLDDLPATVEGDAELADVILGNLDAFARD